MAFWAYVFLAGSFVILGVRGAWRVYQRRRLPQVASLYRRRYVQTLAQIEFAVVRLNSLRNLVPFVKDQQALIEYESALRMMESLLIALSKLPKFGFKTEVFGYIVPMIRRVDTEVAEVYQIFKEKIEANAKSKGLLAVLKREMEASQQGCYFCSRPFMREFFKSATIRVDGIRLKVIGCLVCTAELRSSKEIKVLFFLENGHPVHWSLCPEYKPLEQYWDLNNRKAKYETKTIDVLDD